MLTKDTGHMLSFDLDSTLCDTTHRRGMIEGFHPDWRAYSLACDHDGDGPALPMAQFASLASIPFVIVSARDEDARGKTLNWLNARGVFPWAVLLNDGSHSGHNHGEWKALRLLDAQRITGRKVSCHFDDWSGVAAATEKVGIRTCLVHAPGAVMEYLG